MQKMELQAKKFDELSNNEVYEILKARAEIFISEQKIIYNDMDGIDYASLHCFATENNRVVAYLRAFYMDLDDVVKIGRVLTLKHGKGVGKKLMDYALTVIKQNMPCRKIYLESQKQAVGFYEKFGFEAISNEFLEAGIPHIAMEKRLD